MTLQVVPEGLAATSAAVAPTRRATPKKQAKQHEPTGV